MRQSVALLFLVSVGLVLYYLGMQLSPDGRGMVVGMVFGALVPIPTLLLFLAGQRQRREAGGDYCSPPVHQPPQQLPQPQQPQVVHNHLHIHVGSGETADAARLAQLFAASQRGARQLTGGE